MRKNDPFSSHLRQFKKLSKKVDRMIRSGSFFELEAKERARLTHKLRVLFQRLKQVYKFRTLRRIMAGAALLIGSFGPMDLEAQGFASPQGDPFGSGFSDHPPQENAPQFVDLDNDGDLDILSMDRASYDGDYANEILFHFFENTGSASNPSFSGPQTNPFGLDTLLAIDTTVDSKRHNFEVADLDGDGNQDLMAQAEDSTYRYYENTGSASSPSFAAPQTDPFNLDSIVGRNEVGMAFGDLDNDGDLDMICSVSDTDFVNSHLGTGFLFFENTGTSSNPHFTHSSGKNPFGLQVVRSNYDIRWRKDLSMTDLDQDGDFDLLLNNLKTDPTSSASKPDTGFVFIENTGTASNPSFGTPNYNPFGTESALAVDSSHSVQWQHTVGDLDDDGDPDLMLGATDYYKPGFIYYENTGASSLKGFEKEDELFLYPQPARDRLKFSGLEDREVKTAKVRDIEGRTVLRRSGVKEAVDVSSLSPGIYFLDLRTEQGRFSERFVVER